MRDAEKQVIQDNEIMFLHMERLDSVAQLHFEPKQWSHSWKKYYEVYLADLEKQLAAQGVSLLVEGMKKSNEKGVKLVRSFGFNEQDTGDVILFWKVLDE